MVTIRDILSLKHFSSFKLIAGEQGLDRVVIRGGFIDHESVEDFIGVTLLDEMIFTNLPMIKGEPEKIAEYVNALILSRTSCLAIKKTLFKEIPQEAIDLANAHNYPLFMFDEVFIDKLILDIDEIVNDRKLLTRQLTLIDEIENGNLTLGQVKNHVFELNKYFKEYLKVCIIKSSESSNSRFDVKIAKQLLGKHDLVIPVDAIVFVILSSDTEKTNEQVMIQLLDLNSDDYHIGISSITNDSRNLTRLIAESKIALKYVCYKNEFFSSYKDIGIYQLLIPILDQPFTYNFYTQITQKLIAHDKVNQSELMNTVIAYVNSDGDIKKTAKLLFQHDNTVRYRIRKAKSVLELDELSGMQYETLATAIHLYELNSNRQKFNLL